MYKLGLLLLFISQSIAQKSSAPAAIRDGPRGGGAVFSNKCGGLFGGNDLCYEVTLSKMYLKVGADTTTDEVRAKICTDKTCCETPPLRSAQGGDWRANREDVWLRKHFGLCIDEKFKLKVKTGLNITLIKKGQDTLDVSSLVMETQTVNKDGKKETERFDCGSYKIGGKSIPGRNSSFQSQFCKPTPFPYERVKLINVTMGNDGTDDDVKVDICSNANKVCCQTKLSGKLSDDWSKNDVEIWKEKNLGDCKVMQYKISPLGGPTLALKKNGKDDFVVNKILMETESQNGDKFTYDCGDYKLASQGVKCGFTGVGCTQTRSCKRIKKNGKPYNSNITTTKRPPTSTPRRSDRIANQKTTTRTTSKTTTRPFRSTSG